MQEVDFLNPLLRSRELQRLAEHFHQHNALRLRSPARAVVWNTPRLARLRVLLHSALQPSPSTVKLPPWQCPSSAPAPPQGAPGGSGRLETPRARGRPTGRPALP